MTPTEVEIGRPAPPFRAPSSNGQTLDDATFRGKVPVVLFFAGDADEPDRARLAAFDEHLAEFGKRRVQLLGVHRAPARATRELADHDELNVTLLADQDGAITRAFGLDAATVVIGRDGSVVGLVRRSDDATVHATEVLDVVRSLDALGSGRR